MKTLSLIEKAFFLKKTSVFKDLDLDLLVAISEKINQDSYDANEKVFEIDQKPYRMYLIAKGSVSILDENEKLLSELKEEDFFGEESMFNEKPRAYYAICKKDSLLLTLSRTNLLTIISECPDVAIQLLELYTKFLPCRHR